MELISKQVHTTMLEFLATLNENTLEGIFTARLTPVKFAKHAATASEMLQEALSQEYMTDQIKSWLVALTTPKADEEDDLMPSVDFDPRIKKVLCFREYGDKVGVHFHLRFVTTYRTRKSIADHIKNHFPIPKGTGKGNEAYSVRDCKAKDKTIWKNASYIAKGNDCIFHHGYNALEVEWFCKHAAKYQKMEGKKIWEQIMIWNKNQLENALANRNFANTAITAVLEWHKLKNKDIPQEYQFGKILHNISFCMNEKYRVGMINGLKNTFQRKNKDEGYDMVYIPPTEELPDWHNG